MEQTNKVRPVSTERENDSMRIMTVPDEITHDGFVTVTGNDFVSLPEVDAWGRVLSATFLHAGCAGLVEVRGSRPVDSGADRPAPRNQGVSTRVPFLAPTFVWDGAPVDLAGSTPPEFALEGDWIPTFSWTDGQPLSAGDAGGGAAGVEVVPGAEARSGVRAGVPKWRVSARIVAPPDEKGFCYVLELQRLAREGGEACAGACATAVPTTGATAGPGAEEARAEERVVQAELGVQLTWGYSGIRVFTSRELPFVCTCRYDRWTHSVVAEALGPLPVFAFALNASGDFDHLEIAGPAGDAATRGQGCEGCVGMPGCMPGRATLGPEGAGSWPSSRGSIGCSGSVGTASITVRASKHVTLTPGERATVAFYVAFNREADGARTTSVDLRRQGWEALEAETRRWLAERRVPVPGRPRGREESILNRNLLFCRFFATGKTLDSEEVVAITSRSPRYYVSAAFWARDVLLWALPGLVLIDRARAREVLLYALSAGTMHVGDHAQYMDGRSLYPGFELDEAAAFLVGLGTYLDGTSDFDVIKAPQVLEGMRRVLAEIEKWTLRAADGAPVLCRTSLDPSDDQVRLPFLTYDNVLVRKAWQVAADVLDRLAQTGAHASPGVGLVAGADGIDCADVDADVDADAGADGDGDPSSYDRCTGGNLRKQACRLRDAAEALGEAIRRYCVVDGPFGPMYAWSVGLAPGWADADAGVEPVAAPGETGSARAEIGCHGTPAAGPDGAHEGAGEGKDDDEEKGEGRGLQRTEVELYDNPPGSLELLGYYGYCRDRDGASILANTRRWIRSRHNPYFVEGRFAAPGSAHSPHPWPMAVANSILAEAAARDAIGRCDLGVVKSAVELLTSAPMDFGVACESIDAETGMAKTGAAFASAAGFLGYSLWRGLRMLG